MVWFRITHSTEMRTTLLERTNGTPYDIGYVTDRFGNPNAAGSFAGNSSSYIQIDTTNMNLATPFTVSVWVNPTAMRGLVFLALLATKLLAI
jgi:hypothetical protein